ncbi:MAG: hypothetical protein AAGG75_09465 [Bacteroidota bacterium]
MRRKKAFKKTTGHYFFNVNMGYQNNITISRKTREEAVYAFSNYLKQGKDCEWLGKWDGSTFVDSEYTEAA